MLRCLLIASYEDPPRSFIKPPLGLIWLKKWTLHAGLEPRIDIVDPQLDGVSAVTRALDEPWDVIGFYLTYPTMLDSIDLMIRAWQARRDSHPVLLCGGPGAAFDPLITMAPVTLVVRGEAEKLWVELTRRLIDSAFDSSTGPCDDDLLLGLPGNYRLRHCGKIVPQMAAKVDSTLSAGELDALLEPARWELDMHVPYAEWTRRELDHSYGFPIYATRGCSRPGCRYCSSFRAIDSKGGTRAPSPSAVVRAFEAAAAPPLHARSFILEDDTFVWDRNWMLEVCDKVSAAMRAGRLATDSDFIVKSRVDQFDEPLVARMVASGFRQINVGIESGSPRVLRSVGKVLDPVGYLAHVDELIGWMEKHGLRLHAYMIFFTPESTPEDLVLTIELAVRLLQAGAEISTYETIMALPGSPYERAWHRPEYLLLSESTVNPLTAAGIQEFGDVPATVSLPRTLLPADPRIRDMLNVAHTRFTVLWKRLSHRHGWRAPTSARTGSVLVRAYAEAMGSVDKAYVAQAGPLLARLDDVLSRLETEPADLPENQSCAQVLAS